MVGLQALSLEGRPTTRHMGEACYLANPSMLPAFSLIAALELQRAAAVAKKPFRAEPFKSKLVSRS